MSDTDILPARFIISAAAKREIENMRVFWNANSTDPADVVSVSWAQWRPHVGEPWWNVIVNFYGRSQRDEIAHGIQQVSGLPIVFFTIPKFAAKFDGKIVDFAPNRGFFLRDP